MLEFKTIEILKPNKEIIEIIKNYNYKIKRRWLIIKIGHRFNILFFF